MINEILAFDHHIFYFINQGMQNPFFDKWMPIITDVKNWVWILVLGFTALFLFGKRRGRIASIISVITVVIADISNSYILKPLFHRLRPYLVLNNVHFLGRITGHMPSPSFPSGHATDIFALAMVMSWYYPKTSPAWFLLACVVAYSRVYTGVHYPLDVIGGAVAGILWALIILWIAKKIENRFDAGRNNG